MRGLTALVARVNLRHFRERRLRTALTVAGVAAGVMLVFSIAVINATLLESVHSTSRDLAGAAELEVSTADRNGVPAGFTRRIARLDGVEGVVPVLRTMTMLRGSGSEARAMVIGVTPEFASLFPEDAPDIVSVSVRGGFGRDGRGILLSEVMARELSVGVGRSLLVRTPVGDRRVQVTGLVAGSGAELLNGGRVGVMLLAAAQQTFVREGRVDSVYVVTDREVSPQSVESQIEARFGRRVLVGPPGERGEAFDDTVRSVTTLTSLASTVALLVSVFVVFNTMSMSLSERRREISMSLALGASARQMFAAFIAEAAVFGVAASLVGIAAGYALARVLVGRVLDAFPVLPVSGASPVELPPLQLALGLIGGVLVSLAGAYVPARRVLAVAPVEALRPERSYEWGHSDLPSTLARSIGAATLFIVLSAGCAAAFVFFFEDDPWLVNAGLGFGLMGITALLLRTVPFALRVLRPVLGRAVGTVGRLAADALAKNPSRTTFTVAALTLTLGMVIGVGTALTSYEQELERSAGYWLGADLYVTSDTYHPLGSDQPLERDVQAQLARVDGAAGVYPVRYSFIQLGGDQMMIYAIPAARAAREGFEDLSRVGGVDQQELLENLGAGRVFIARFTAEEQGWAEGQTVTLPTPAGDREFVVGGIFDDLNSFQSMFIEHEVYERLWRDDKIDRLGVVLDDGASLDAVRTRLESVVEAQGIPARVLDRRQAAGQIVETVDGLFSIARGVQFAALVVALLTIANTMFTAVLERRWEMGLQRAVGMGRRQIFRALIVETGAIGLIGGLGAIVMGTATGFFMTQLIEAQYSWTIAYQVPLPLTAASVSAGLVIALVAGVFPARLAVRVPMIEALRYE